MVAFNISVDDSSPLLTYSGSWLDTPTNDTLAVNYTDGSLHATYMPGAKVTLQFNGTAVWFFGGRRPSYGSYVLLVDGSTVGTGTAASSSPQLEQPLIGSANLTMGQHTATLMSAGGGPMDVDYAVFQTALGGPGRIMTQALDDSAANITYVPEAPTWSTANHTLFSNSTVHYTQSVGAQASLAFSGEAVSVYGGVSFDHGNYTVTLDGKSQNFTAGGSREYHAQTLLYFANGLGPGNHNLTMTANGGFFDVDSIQVHSVISGSAGSNSFAQTTDGSTGFSSTTSASPYATTARVAPVQPPNGDDQQPHTNMHDSAAMNFGSSGSAKTTLSKPLLIGLIAASAVALLAIIAVIVLLISRRRRRRRTQEFAQRLASPTLPIQQPDIEGNGGGAVIFVDGTVYTPAPVSRAAARELARNNSQMTTQTRWSQDSFVTLQARQRRQSSAGFALEPAPPVPPLRFASRQNNAPASVPARSSSRQSDVSDASASSGAGESADGRSVGDGDRSSTASSVAPLRPTRPPTLDLRGIPSEFESISLSR